MQYREPDAGQIEQMITERIERVMAPTYMRVVADTRRVECRDRAPVGRRTE